MFACINSTSKKKNTVCTWMLIYYCKVTFLTPGNYILVPVQVQVIIKLQQNCEILQCAVWRGQSGIYSPQSSACESTIQYAYLHKQAAAASPRPPHSCCSLPDKPGMWRFLCESSNRKHSRGHFRLTSLSTKRPRSQNGRK